jgi:cell division protein FtsQ
MKGEGSTSASLPPRPRGPVELGDAPEGPFLRPKQRTKVRRTRRGPVARTLLALHSAAFVVIAFGLIWFGYSRVMASQSLRVTRVEVRGGHFLSQGEVRELLGPAVGENILSLNIEDLKKRLRASPWVADAAVGRTLPDTLRVEIEERSPIALAEVDRLYLMDGNGTLIELYGPRTAAFDLPVVRGLGGLGPDERRERARRVATVLGDLQDLAKEISELRVDTDLDVEAVLRSGDVVRLGEPPYRKKLVTFLGLRGQLRLRSPEAELFDLRFRDRIYAKERPTAAPPAPAAAPAVSKTPATAEIPVPVAEAASVQ